MLSAIGSYENVDYPRSLPPNVMGPTVAARRRADDAEHRVDYAMWTVANDHRIVDGRHLLHLWHMDL